MEPLTIRQTNNRDEVTILTIEKLTICCSRFISNRLYKFNVNVEDSIGDLGAKINTISSLTNDMFKDMDRINRQSKD